MTPFVPLASQRSSDVYRDVPIGGSDELSFCRAAIDQPVVVMVVATVAAVNTNGRRTSR